MFGRKQYQATKEELALRNYRCVRCGARGEVAFRAVGRSTWIAESLLGEDPVQAAWQQAEQDLMNDADRALALVKCPTCGMRPPRAMFWVGVRVTLWLGVAAGGLAIGGATGVCVAAGFGVGAIIQGLAERTRFHRATRAVFPRLVPGALPEPRRPRLPEARAIAAPPAEPEAPPPLVAPEPPPTPSPDGQPRFLRNDSPRR